MLMKLHQLVGECLIKIIYLHFKNYCITATHLLSKFLVCFCGQNHQVSSRLVLVPEADVVLRRLKEGFCFPSRLLLEQPITAQP